MKELEKRADYERLCKTITNAALLAGIYSTVTAERIRERKKSAPIFPLGFKK